MKLRRILGVVVLGILPNTFHSVAQTDARPVATHKLSNVSGMKKLSGEDAKCGQLLFAAA